VINLAIDNLHLAGGAQTVTAGMRQVNPRAQAGIEDGLAILDIDSSAKRFDSELVRHGLRARPLDSVQTRCLETQAILMFQAIFFEALVEIGHPGLA
jgi:hypothetical protein